jgi:hypothetical protein
MSRRAQMEMIGLVMVVVILIFGILIYMQLASKPNNAPAVAKTAQANNAYLTAMLETDIPQCRVTFRELAQACGRKVPIGSCPDSCEAVQASLDTIVANTLEKEGRQYNISITMTEIQKESGCKSAEPKTRIISGAQLPLVLGDGRTREFSLKLCR